MDNINNKLYKLNKGAGCGASDLLVVAVILDPKSPIIGLNDSKKLTEKKENCYTLKL